MPKFQLISAFVMIGGDQNNQVHRGPDQPLTLPEIYVLRSIHGGEDKVHELVVVGEVERSMAEERDRLIEKYGSNRVTALFPVALPLPAGDEGLPTADEVAAGEKAKAEAVAKVRAKKDNKPKGGTADLTPPTAPAVPPALM